jgi:hypothetical protein
MTSNSSGLCSICDSVLHGFMEGYEGWRVHFVQIRPTAWNSLRFLSEITEDIRVTTHIISLYSNKYE